MNGIIIENYFYDENETPRIYINKRENVYIRWNINGEVIFAGTIEGYQEFLLRTR